MFDYAQCAAACAALPVSQRTPYREAILDQILNAGLANGGTTCEDPPGQRPSGMYLAYLRDPSGNKICALHRPG